MPNPPTASRADVIALLQDGLSDKYIGHALRTSPMRVSRIRGELELPRYQRTVITLEQAWAIRTQPTPDGHLAWTGFWRKGAHPVFKHQATEHSARRLAFRMANGREPEGSVTAGCGWAACVKPEHVEDQRMRDQYNAIFGV